MNNEDSKFSDVVIRASAGSGKTFQLSNRYLKLLLSNEPVERILATTFTKKAAGEILDRILMRLGGAALDDEGCSSLSRQLYADENKLHLSEVRSLLDSLVKNFHRLRICTLDSFFMKIAGNFALELGLPPHWQIAEQPEIKRGLRTAIRNVFYNLTNTPNNVALKLMRFLDKGTIDRAVAEQIFDLSQKLSEIYRQSKKEAWETIAFQKEIDEQELAREFEFLQSADLPKNKSGKALDQRVAKKRDILKDLILDKNWDDFICDSLVLRAGENPCVYYGHDLEEEAPVFLKALRVFLHQAQAIFLNKLSGQTRGTWLLLDYINKEVDRLKKEEGNYTFSDITDLLSKSEWSQHQQQLVHRLDAETNHLLLDEFQDTSCPQWTILNPLALRAINSKEGSFFCVGDVKQAIYGWRGGNSGIFDSVAALVGITSESLCDNWRSSPVIIETVNAIFSDIKNNEILTAPGSSKNTDYQSRMQDAFVRCCFNWQKRFERHQSAEKNRELSGYASFELAPLWDNEQEQIVLPPEDALMDPNYDPDFWEEQNESKTKNSNDEENISKFHSSDWEDFSSTGSSSEEAVQDEVDRTQKQSLLNYTIRRIIELHHQTPHLEIGVLLRTNDQIAEIVTALRKRGLNVSEEGGTPLDVAASVEVILSILTIADHPEDTVALYHLTTVPELSQFFQINESNYADPQCGCAISHWLRRELLARGLPAIISEFARLIIPHCNSREEERLERLMELACKYQDRQNTRFDFFIERVRAERVETSGGSSIRVMTIHRSKGLEFDIVVLPQLDKKIQGISPEVITHRPTPLSDIDSVFRYVGSEGQTILPEFCKEHLRDYWSAVFEESLSDLYVAVTRPVRQLVMIAPPKKNEEYTEKNWANIIRFALTVNSKTENQPELWRPDGSRTIWQIGDPHWGQKEKSEAKTEEKRKEQPLFAPQYFTLKFSPCLQKNENDKVPACSTAEMPEKSDEEANLNNLKSKETIKNKTVPEFETEIILDGFDKAPNAEELPLLHNLQDTSVNSSNSGRPSKKRKNTKKPEKKSTGFLFDLNDPSNYFDSGSNSDVNIKEKSQNSQPAQNSNSAIQHSRPILPASHSLPGSSSSLVSPDLPDLASHSEFTPMSGSSSLSNSTSLSEPKYSSSSVPQTVTPPAANVPAVKTPAVDVPAVNVPVTKVPSDKAPSDKGKRKWNSGRNFEQGTAIHLCFQQIQWLDQKGAPDKKKLHQILQSIIFSKDQEDRIIQNFYNMLKNNEIRDMLSLSCYTRSGKTPINTSRKSSALRWSVEQERPYSFLRKDGTICQGVIDRLVVLYEGTRVIGADIIDYKTDHIDEWNNFGEKSDSETIPPQALELLKIYTGQLHEYQSAVMRLYHLPANKISCRCAFVSHGKIFDL